MESEGKSRTSSYFCRICHDDGDLVSLCKCTGTVGLIHANCLEKWLSTNGKTSCEICGFDYQCSSRLRSLPEWVQSLKQENEQRRYLFCDVLSLVLLTPLLLFAFGMCVMGGFQYHYNGAPSEANSLLVLAVLIVLVYIVWIYLLLSHNLREFKTWRERNPEVKLIMTSSV